MNLYYNTTDWQPATLTLICARPAVGKTPFMTDMAKYMAENDAMLAAIFSLEMSKAQIEHYLDPIGQAPIHIDDTAYLTLADLQTKAREAVKENGAKIIMIDFLQPLVDANREEGIASIMASLKSLAVELNIPIILFALLPRAAADADPCPSLSELADYDAIKDCVDMIAFLHRPGYYTPNPYDTKRLELFVAHTK